MYSLTPATGLKQRRAEMCARPLFQLKNKCINRHRMHNCATVFDVSQRPILTPDYTKDSINASIFVSSTCVTAGSFWCWCNNACVAVNLLFEHRRHCANIEWSHPWHALSQVFFNCLTPLVFESRENVCCSLYTQSEQIIWTIFYICIFDFTFM